MKAVAENKRTKNIGEYIIYMYQMEDLIRAYQLNITDIHQYVISHYPVSNSEKEVTKKWFEELIDLMKREKVEQVGHLSIVKEKVDELAQIHWSLLKKDIAYFELFSKAKPHILDLILEAGEKSPGHEIQLCFNTIYGLLLARLRGREVPQNIINAATAFGDLLSYLNKFYLDQQNQKIRNN